MDEFEYYCQLARSSGSKNYSNRFLNPSEPESSQRVRSHSLLPSDTRNTDMVDNRRDSLQYPNFRTRSVKENRSNNSSRQRLDSTYNNDESNQSLYRVRSLKKTSKGVINKGDSLRTHSSTSINEEEIRYSYPCAEYHSSAYLKEDNDLKKIGSEISYQKSERLTYPSRNNSKIHWHQSCKQKSNKLTSFDIQVLGAPLVGKSSMCEQFQTSEYLGNSNIPDRNNESNTVTIDLDGNEWNLKFLDTVRDEDEDPNKIHILPNADGYMVVYAIDEYGTFEFAKTILKHLRNEAPLNSTLFLVANKSDLERGREISSEDGKHLAKACDCEFLEISTALNHMVDDLLVKIINKICQQKEKYKDKKDIIQKRQKTRTNTITNFFRKHFSKNSQSTIDNH